MPRARAGKSAVSAQPWEHTSQSLFRRLAQEVSDVAHCHPGFVRAFGMSSSSLQFEYVVGGSSCSSCAQVHLWSRRCPVEPYGSSSRGKHQEYLRRKQIELLAVTRDTYVKRTSPLCPISAFRQQYAPRSGPDLAAQRPCSEPCLRMQVLSLGRPFCQTSTATTA